MLEARTAWAIMLLLAPTGVAAAGVATVKVPEQHTAYVEIVIEGESEHPEIASVEARVDCLRDSSVQQAIAWVRDEEDCTTPPGAAVYVTDAQAPTPRSGSMVPTGTVYAYEDADRVWTVREYTYAGPAMGERHHAYVMAPDVADRVDDDRPGEPVRGVVNLDKMGVAPGESIELSTKVGPAPQVTPEDPTIERIGADSAPSLPTADALGVRG